MTDETGADTPALVAVQEGVLLQHVADETVLLQLESGVYYTLDEVGTRMLDLACERSSVASVVETLLDEYDATPEMLESDLEKLLGELEAHSLVVLRA